MTGNSTNALVQAATVPNQTVVIGKSDSSAYTVTITPYAGDTIDGMSSLVLSTQWDLAELRSDGANTWRVMSLQLHASSSAQTSTASGLPFIPLKTPTLVKGVSGGNLGSSGYTFVVGRFMFSTADLATANTGSFSIWDIQATSTSTAPVLVGQLVGTGSNSTTTLRFAEGVWADPTLSYAVVCVYGDTTSSSTQAADRCVLVIHIAACINAYLNSLTPVAPTVSQTLTDATNLSSPENLLVVATSSGTFGYVSNALATAAGGYAVLNLTNLAAVTVVGAVTDPSYVLAEARYAICLGTTIYVTTAGGYLVALSIATPSVPTILGSLNLSIYGYLTGVDAWYYPLLGSQPLGKTFCFVAMSASNAIMSIDVTNPAAMVKACYVNDNTSFSAPSNVHIVGGAVAYTTSYNTGGGSGITLVDISNPYAFFVISFTSCVSMGLPSGTIFDHLHIAGSRGYQTDTSSPPGGVYVIQLGGGA